MEKHQRKQKGKIKQEGDAFSSYSPSSLWSAGSRGRDIKRKKLREVHRARLADGEAKEEEEKRVGDGDGDGDDDDGVLEDPLVVLGSDVMLRILSRLDACSVAQCLLVSRGWRGVASNDTIWTSKCEELWLGKAHIPRISKVHGLPKLAAYSLSCKDGKRTRITKEDLCDHAWEFHFTEEAPEYWRNLDPYSSGTGSPMHRHFHPDGSHSADPGDRVWGGHESCYSVVTSFLGDGKMRKHYVRINRWPPLSVSRKPDWSWELRSRLVVYSSIRDPEKEDGTGPSYNIF